MELALQYTMTQSDSRLWGSHNPCFYGISFAIGRGTKVSIKEIIVTILVFMELALQ